MSRKLLAAVGGLAAILAVGGAVFAWSQPRGPAKVLKRFDYKIHTFSGQWQAVAMDRTADGLRFDVTYLHGQTPYHVAVFYSRPEAYRVTVRDDDASSWTLCNTNDRQIEYRGHNESQKMFLTCLSKVAANSLRYAVGH